jgi:hypothetical protein
VAMKLDRGLLHGCPEDGGGVFLQNIGNRLEVYYTLSQTRRSRSIFHLCLLYYYVLYELSNLQFVFAVSVCSCIAILCCDIC